MNLFSRRKLIVAVVVDACRVDGCEVKIMGTAMFYSPIYTILLVVTHSSKNKTEKVDGFAVIFDGIQLSQMANNFQI